MAKFRYSYSITLNLAFPNIFAPKDFGLGETSKQIHKAEEMFNARFVGRKELSIYNIEDQNISMILLVSYVPNNITREVSAFSQILVKEFNFDQYSAKSGRLFDASAESLPEDRDLAEIQEEDMTQEEAAKRDEESNYIEYAEYLKSRQPKQKENTFLKMSNEILATDDVDKLDNYIQQLQNLVSIANTKKDIMIRNKI